MLWSGHQDCALFQAKNLRLEQVNSLPLHTVDDIGRVIFVTPPDPLWGTYVGGDTEWIKIEKRLISHSFHYWLFDTTDVNERNVFEATGISDKIFVPFDCYILAMGVQVNPAISSGTGIRVRPTINGTPLAIPDLDVIVATGNYHFEMMSALNNDVKVAMTDFFGVVARGYLDTLPATLDLLVDVLLVSLQ